MAASSSAGATRTSMPSGAARVRTTSIVCGSTSAATANTREADFVARWQRVIASAAAVASSSIDALAMSSAARSVIMVWKLSSASSRPCEISGWYGV